MALSMDTLTDKIRRLTDPTHPNHAYPATRAAAIAAWRDAYDTYAAVAKDRSDDAVTSKSPSGFAGALSSGWSNAWTLGEAADAFVAACDAYWTGGVFAVGSMVPGTGSGSCQNVGGGTRIFALEQTSVVTVAVFTPRRPDFIDVFSDLTANGEQKAAEIADVFHYGTTTDVTVLITGLDTTPPPVGPLPVTNTCKVF